MRFVSFCKGEERSWGALVNGTGVIDLGKRLADEGLTTLKAALEQDAIARICGMLAGWESDFEIDDVRLDPVVPNPGQILCIGLNYESHRLETKRAATGYPTVFARFGRSQVGHGAPIIRPLESTMLDFEGELAIIIGKSARRCSPADAMSIVAGYSCYNDASVRDFQRHTSQFHPGKNFPATGSFGPWMVTCDEVRDHTELKISTRLNGEVVQSAGLDQLIFSIPDLITYCSTFNSLEPGDVIVTGTPGGVGSGRTPPLWMKPGDVVEVEITEIGLLRNPVQDEGGAQGIVTGRP